MSPSGMPQPRPTTMEKVDDNRRVVGAILEQIPELLKVKHVRRRDGSLADFAPERLGGAIAGALKDAGVHDELLLARCTHQALMRIDREFYGHVIPSTEDLTRVVVLVLLENNLPFAVKRYLQRVAPEAPPAQRSSIGVRFRRRHTRPGTHPFDMIEWDRRDAVITNEKGKVVFEQRGVEVPRSWSQ